MTFTPIPATSTDQDSPGDQTLMDLIRLDLDDHETRIKVVEDPNSRVFSHFNSRHDFDPGGGAANRIVNGAGGGGDASAIYESQFWLGIASGGSAGDSRWVESMATSDTTFQHWIMFEMAAGGHDGALYTTRGFKFADVTKPINYKARLKLSANTLDYWFGMARGEYTTNFGVPARGIYLERNTTNWRFVAKDSGGSTNGTPFSPVTATNWFEIEIKFEDSPGNQARCYVDGVLKETFTTNLPTGEVLFATAKAATLTGDLKIDRLEWKAGAQLANAA